VTNHSVVAFIVYKIILHNIRFNSAFHWSPSVGSFARGAVVVVIESALAYSGMMTLYLVLLVTSSHWCLVIVAVVSRTFTSGVHLSMLTEILVSILHWHHFHDHHHTQNPRHEPGIDQCRNTCTGRKSHKFKPEDESLAHSQGPRFYCRVTGSG
jgi:hypothetical protein